MKLMKLAKLALIPLLILTANPLFAANASSAAATTPAAMSASAPATPSVTPEQRAQIETVVHEYLQQKPEVVLEALQTLQRRQYDQAQQTVKDTQQNVAKFADALFRQANDPVAGNANGNISVVEFFDYQCPHCVDMAPVIDGIIKANHNVRIVFKDFPIRGPMSELAARAALAANKQGKYFAFHHALLTIGQPLTEDLIYQTAKNVGLNVDKMKKDVNDPAISNQLKADMALAQGLKLFGTLAFFIGQTKANTSSGINYVPGQLSLEQLQDFISKASQ